MCVNFILIWACGHNVAFDFISCEMGNLALPDGCRLPGGIVTEYSARDGLCKVCLRARAEIAIAAAAERRRVEAESDLGPFDRHAIDTSRMRGKFLITQGIEAIGAGEEEEKSLAGRC